MRFGTCPHERNGIPLADEGCQVRNRSVELASTASQEPDNILRNPGPGHGRADTAVTLRLSPTGHSQSPPPMRSGRFVHPSSRRRGAVHDDYGRILEQGWVDVPRTHFYRTVPVSPFRINTARYTTKPDPTYPDHPILQFWTWTAWLRIAGSVPSLQINGIEKAAAPPPSPQEDQLKRYSIYDESGDWCGSILLSSQWLKKQDESNFDGSKHKFLTISDAKSFSDDERGEWTYYIPKERDQPEWDRFYVMLVERKNMINYRLALGKVFKAAFDNSVQGRKWQEIVLG